MSRRGAPIVHQPIDGEGMVVDRTLDGCRLVYVTPSHQAATGVTMSLDRRCALLEKAAERDMLVIEDDFDCESNYKGYPHPALRGMDRDNRVIYLSCLSKVLAPGLRLGFMVAAPELIAEARKLRRLMVGQPPRNNQRAMAHFIRLGHYDALTTKLHETFGRRWEALRVALNFYLPPWVALAPSNGGTLIWVQGAEGLDVSRLVDEAAHRGVLVEPVEHFYGLARRPLNCFRMGVSGIKEERIRAGVATLAAVVREFTEGATEHLDQCQGRRLLARRTANPAAGRVDADQACLRRAARDPLERVRHDERAVPGSPGRRPRQRALVDRGRPLRAPVAALVVRGTCVVRGGAGRGPDQVLPRIGLHRGHARRSSRARRADWHHRLQAASGTTPPRLDLASLAASAAVVARRDVR